MKKKHRSRKETNFLKHAAERALERYHFYLGEYEIREIRKLIDKHDIISEERKDEQVSIIRLDYDSRRFKIMYNRKQKLIITFLPLENGY